MACHGSMLYNTLVLPYRMPPHVQGNLVSQCGHQNPNVTGMFSRNNNVGAWCAFSFGLLKSWSPRYQFAPDALL